MEMQKEVGRAREFNGISFLRSILRRNPVHPLNFIQVASLSHPGYSIQPENCNAVGYVIPSFLILALGYFAIAVRGMKLTVRFHLSELILAQLGLGFGILLLIFASRTLSAKLEKMDIAIDAIQTCDWTVFKSIVIACLWFTAGYTAGLLFFGASQSRHVVGTALAFCFGGSSFWLALLTLNSLSG